MLNPWFLLAGVLLLLSIGGGAYWQGREDGRAAVESESARDERVAQVAREAAAQGAAEAISKIEIKHVTIRQQTLERVLREPVYVDCRHGDDVRRLLDAALQNLDIAAGAPGGGELPKANAPQ